MSDNTTETIRREHKENKRNLKFLYTDRQGGQAEQVKKCQADLEQLRQEQRALECKITTVKTKLATIKSADYPKLYGAEKYLSQQTMMTKLIKHFKDNTELVYTQLREQTQLAQQIYNDFVTKRVARRLANNQFIWTELKVWQNKFTVLMTERDRIKTLPYTEATKLLPPIEQELTLLQRTIDKYHLWTKCLESPTETFPPSFSLTGHPPLVKSNTADIVSTYQQLREIYVTWFKLYNKVNKVMDHTKNPYSSYNLTRTALYAELKPFFQLYSEFQRVFCDSTILQDEFCYKCQGGLIMLVNNERDPYFEKHDTYVVIPDDNYSSHGDNNYTTWSCEEKKVNPQI